VRFGFLGGGLGAGRGGLVGNVALLRQLRFLLLALDLQRLLLGFEILLRDRDLGVADGQVALLPLGLGDARQRGQALGVEGVVGIEILGVGLVEAGERGAFQLQAVQQQVGRHCLLHRLHELGALFLQIGQRHGRRDRAQRVDELGFDQLTQLLGVVGAIAEGLGGECDRLGVRLHADIELDADVDAHAILGDHGVDFLALHLEAQGLQVDPSKRLEHRQHQRAAVQHDLLSPEAGADIGDVLGGPAVEPADDGADGDQADDPDDHRQADCENQFHETVPRVVPHPVCGLLNPEQQLVLRR
jgi:hypothetical protein